MLCFRQQMLLASGGGIGREKKLEAIVIVEREQGPELVVIPN